MVEVTAEVTAEPQVGVDPNILIYLRQADATFRNGFDDEEMKEIFMENVFDEIKGNQKKLSYMKSSSYIMDNFISYAASNNILNFFQEISDDIMEFSNGQCSCHVLQKALQRYVSLQHEQKMEASTNQKIRKCLMSWCDEISKDVETLSNFICGSYSTHVARSYIQALCGIILPVETSKNNFGTNTQEEESKQVVLDEDVVDKKLLKCFKTLVSKICTFDRKTSIETFTDVSGSPFISILLKVARLRSVKCLKEVCSFIVSPPTALANNSKQIVLLCKDKLSSRIMESLFEVGSKECCLQLFDILFENSDIFLQLTTHSSANFAIQRMLSCRFLQFKERFSKMFEIIVDSFEMIYASEKMGIIQKLTEQCLVKKTYQKRLLKALLKLFGCTSEESEKHLVYLIATSSTYEMFQKSSASNRSRPPSYHGSMLLQVLMKFDDISLLLQGFMLLTKEQFLTFISNSAGSHLIDAFFAVENIEQKHKKEFLNFILEQAVCEVACDKYGSRILENLWKTASLPRKQSIVGALAEHSEKVAGDRFGRHISRNFAIRLFISRPEKWTEMQQQESKKRKQMNKKKGEWKKARTEE